MGIQVTNIRTGEVHLYTSDFTLSHCIVTSIIINLGLYSKLEDEKYREGIQSLHQVKEGRIKASKQLCAYCVSMNLVATYKARQGRKPRIKGANKIVKLHEESINS